MALFATSLDIEQLQFNKVTTALHSAEDGVINTNIDLDILDDTLIPNNLKLDFDFSETVLLVVKKKLKKFNKLLKEKKQTISICGRR